VKAYVQFFITFSPPPVPSLRWRQGSPRPHHNTVATLLKILVDKKYVGIRNAGRFNHYFARIQKSEFTNMTLSGLTKGYFEGSYQEMVSFMVDQKKISLQDLELILKQLKTGKK
jgi:predicted transcriptional regulator